LEVLEHDPTRYLPVAHLVLEQAEHCVLLVDEQALLWYLPLLQVAQTEQVVPVVPMQPPLLYLPLPHVSQAEHEKPLTVPEHDPVRTLPAAHLLLEHTLHW